MIIRYPNWGVKPVYSFIWLVAPHLPPATLDWGGLVALGDQSCLGHPDMIGVGYPVL